ncbi:conserved hypothetical protein [Paenibacillus curdlanolyticus YK9]|uniref:Uncharacterized protein n=1 Tax=Paenibacillus curdlanolyticus YK9 TaxID=717606 RepID=E0I6X9_9BACL|nr:hypothetical protein [Paenibacillus curdlanolyticus]EFM11795.1 conserved hypothetical protein [Paenibacillus curdlanolyticus YK9]
MEPIFPLHEDHVSRFCGLPVCIVTKDGKRHVGVLSNCRGGRVMLNGDPSHHSGPNAYLDHHDSSELAKNKKGKQHKKNKKAYAQEEQQQVQTKDYGYDDYGYGGGYGYNPWGTAFAIDLSLIAFLFLLL